MKTECSSLCHPDEPCTITENGHCDAKAPDELHFLQWFYGNCDFGPAHSDVIDLLKEQYVEDTGKPIPEGY